MKLIHKSFSCNFLLKRFVFVSFNLINQLILFSQTNIALKIYDNYDRDHLGIHKIKRNKAISKFAPYAIKIFATGCSYVDKQKNNVEHRYERLPNAIANSYAKVPRG